MKKPKLTRAAELDLVARMRAGDEKAFHALVRAHVGLAYRIALKFQPCTDDLKQEAVLGLMRALRTYDPAVARVSTYASQWIRSFVFEAYRRNRGAVRWGQNNRHRSATQVSRAQADLRSVGIEPTDEAVAERTGMAASDVTFLHGRHAGDVPIDAFVDAHEGMAGSFSRLGELLTTHATPEAEVAASQEQRQRVERVRLALSSLDPRERFIIRRRFLVNDQDTLADIGRHYGMTRERIRQLEVRAMAKMRAALAGAGVTTAEAA